MSRQPTLQLTDRWAPSSSAFIRARPCPIPRIRKNGALPAAAGWIGWFGSLLRLGWAGSTPYSSSSVGTSFKLVPPKIHPCSSFLICVHPISSAFICG